MIASFKNEIFHSSIKSVQLANNSTTFEMPILTLNSEEQLNLSFDFLEDDATDFSYTYIKCDINWEKYDNIFFHDFAEGVEEKFITEFDFSENTTTNYIHYSLDFPSSESKFLLSGNYVIIVRNTETSKVVLTRKFYVLESKTKINPEPTQPLNFEKRKTHQLINFTVNYSMITSDNPSSEFKAVVIQNGRYDNRKYNLKPSFFKENRLMFNNENKNLFESGNEYRILDFRDLKQTGQGVEEIFFKDSVYHIIPTIDYNRAYSNYQQSPDHNGKFFIEKKPRIGNPDITSDYAFVHFRSARKIPLDSSSVFIINRIYGGELNENLRMIYKDSLEHYEAHLLLKQGVYDYAYASNKSGEKNLSWIDTDGSHYETKNAYTILIYFKGFNDETETLIGVKRFVFQ